MAFAAVERLIAFRYLRARREEGFISVIAGFSLVGITLGVGTLIVVMSVMNGFRVEMLHQMSSISGQLGVQGNRERPRRDAGPAGARAGRARRRDARRPRSRARSWPWPAIASAAWSCAACSPTISGRARRSPPRSRGRRRCATAIAALCRGDDDKPIDWGSLKGFGNDFSVVIGRRLADLLGLKVGDSLQLVSPVSIATPLGVMPRSAAARVAAIFCAGMYDYDANFVYAPLVDAQRLLDLGGKVTGIEVFVDDDASVGADAPAGLAGRSARRAGCSTGSRPMSASSPPSRPRPT